ncbi:MAG TPA: DegT/DnrJ/EryC1/StrS aminotransferase family protein, partial [Candidatus Baltobacteraceae bacterium]|nr:DegT/DnrJ/EryC1/StrS aminotransferase family protein [Candidatus Baltobacteraceae bacterium]
MRDTFLPYCRPDVDDREMAAIAECIRNGWLTTGPKVREFEETFAKLTGAKHAVAVNSCTAALHIGLLAAGVEPGDEVVTPSLTFVAGAQCTREVGATPVFCEVDEQTLTAHWEHFEAAITPRTKAIIAMPYAGRPMDIRTIVEPARARGITVLEDAAHAAGMLDRGHWAGCESALAAYSFYATKNITTAEGGMLVTNDDEVADRVRALALHGMDKDAWKRYTARGSWRYDVREPGFKYNMPDIAAAMGIVQLERLEAMQQRREELAAQYIDALSSIPGLYVQKQPENAGDRHAWCMFVIRVDEQAAGISRDDLIEELKSRNIGTSVHYIPTHQFSGYRAYGSDRLPNTERAGGQIISLPLYPSMSDDDARDVIEAIKASIMA